MNALTPSLEEVSKPIESDSVIRILKSQYDKKKTQLTSQEEQGFVGTSSKKVHLCTNCKKQAHSIETCWSKCGGKEGQGPRQKKRSKFKKKKGKGKANAAEEEDSTDEKSGGLITFINFDCTAFKKTAQESLLLLILVLAHI